MCILIKLILNFYKTYICVSLIFLITLLIIFFPKKTYAADCADVNGTTVTYTSDCRQIVVTGDGSNITIDGATIKGRSSDDEKGIVTTNGTNTTITINSDAGIGYDTADGLDRYGIQHAAGSGSITTITNNGRIETKQSTTNGAGYPIFNGSTIGDIVNSGQIYSNSKVAIQNTKSGTINKIENTATGNIWSKQKYTIQNFNTIGTITNAGMIRSSKEQAIRNATNASSVPTITLIENKSGATIQADNETIMNSGRGIITTIKNAGTIKALADGQAIHNFNATIGTIENTGTISAIDGNGAIYNNATGAIGTITNSGDITGDDSNAAIKNEGAITTINNSGNITDSTDDGIKNILGATIATINNTGTITGGSLDINNANDAGQSGTITTLNNSQGGNDALTYGYKLPTNYNVIVNSTSDYGKIVFSNKSGTTTFGVHSTSTLTGSSVNTTYSDVISGLTESDLVSCTSDTDCITGDQFEGTNKYYWKLDDTNNDDDWDLIITAIESSVPPASKLPKTPTLESMNSLKAVTDANFAHMNTYDCDFFGNNNDTCLSLGGRRSKVTNPSSTTDGLVLVGGKRFSDQLRIGGFYHTNTKHDTAKNLKLSDNTPLLGSLIVWNQKSSGLGFQVKYANAYQEKNATITREAGESSEEGTGKTLTKAISNTIETRYVISKKNKINYTPYFASRYAVKTQDSYTEVGPVSPLTYNKINDKALTVLLGTRIDANLTPALNLHATLGIEHDVYHTISKLTPTGMSGLPTVNLDANLKKTRPVVSLGFDYDLSSNNRFSSIIQYQELAYENMTQTNLYIYYSKAF
ncbi:autotransporter domain-containing protein [Candidatus Pelagibacter bacterium nBUS_36]|uniref:autotransporter outer membrane beta-barrel domain-containing protein n=1 Tax=Candidatus Pelagibacter bacterium nBUS_36 TaxID=3374194 RepID=UPI003EC040D8